MKTETVVVNDVSRFLRPSLYIDSLSSEVRDFVDRALEGLDDRSDKGRAIRLFEAVRDQIRYDPYALDFRPDSYRASVVAGGEATFCVPKAILLTACLRAVGIPAAVGFADVRNHLNSPKLAALMETDLFMYHGYVQLWLGGKVYKVAPAFNMELCKRFGIQPLVFDGQSDALFHEFDTANRRHMEYVRDRGIYEDPPIDEILSVLEKSYPRLAEFAREKAASGEVAGASDSEFSGQAAESSIGSANITYKYFDDFSVGQVMNYEVDPVSREDVMEFAREWDPQRLHLDEAYGQRTHGGLIASGLQTLLHVMRPVMTHFMARCENIGGLGFDNLRWPKPVRPGDRLTVRLEITEIRASRSKPDRGVVAYRVEAWNPQNELVLTAETAVMMRRRQ